MTLFHLEISHSPLLSTRSQTAIRWVVEKVARGKRLKASYSSQMSGMARLLNKVGVYNLYQCAVAHRHVMGD